MINQEAWNQSYARGVLKTNISLTLDRLSIVEAQARELNQKESCYLLLDNLMELRKLLERSQSVSSIDEAFKRELDQEKKKLEQSVQIIAFPV